MHDLNTPAGADWALLGAIGGFARVAVVLLKLDKMPPPAKIFWLFVANGLVSGFSGYLGAVAMSAITPNDNLYVVSAGIFGWLGVSGLEFLTSKIKDKMKT